MLPTTVHTHGKLRSSISGSQSEHVLHAQEELLSKLCFYFKKDIVAINNFCECCPCGKSSVLCKVAMSATLIDSN